MYTNGSANIAIVLLVSSVHKTGEAFRIASTVKGTKKAI